MRLVPLVTILVVAVMSSASAGQAAGPAPRDTGPDYATPVDNIYVDADADADDGSGRRIAKFVTPFDPPITLGEIYVKELEGTWEMWDGRVFLVHRPLVVVNEIRHEWLAHFNMVPDPSKDTRPGYLAAQERLKNDPERQARLDARRPMTPERAIAHYDRIRGLLRAEVEAKKKAMAASEAPNNSADKATKGTDAHNEPTDEATDEQQTSEAADDFSNNSSTQGMDVCSGATCESNTDCEWLTPNFRCFQCTDGTCYGHYVHGDGMADVCRVGRLFVC